MENAENTLPFELTEDSLPGYLCDIHWEENPKAVKVRELTGGVSNRAFWVDGANGAYVVKQARPKLAVQMDWEADVNRIVREAMGIQFLGQRLGKPHIPRLLFLDREAKVLLMEAISPEAENYKTMLLRGDVNPAHAEQFGTLLARMHNATCDGAAQQAFADPVYFDQLRLSPYYGTVAERHPDLAPRMEQLREECLNEGYCLVHGDYSPKNVLVLEENLVLLDYEVAHWGNPSFDVGFALTHYLAKALHMPRQAHLLLAAARVFWQSYAKRNAMHPHALEHAGHHLAAIMLARVDGKSPLEYLTERGKQEALRGVARAALLNEDVTVPQVIAAVEGSVGA